MKRSYVIMTTGVADSPTPLNSKPLSDVLTILWKWSQHLKVESNTFDQRKYTVCVHVPESDRERLQLNFREPHFQFVFPLILLSFLVCPLQKPDTLLAFYPSVCQKWPGSIEEPVESKTF